MARKQIKVSADLDKAFARVDEPSTVLSPDMRAKVLALIGEGATLTGVCRRRGMPALREVYATAERDPQFAADLDKARALQATSRIDRAADILDEAMEGNDIDAIRGAAVYAEQVNKHASLVAPKQYGTLVKLAGHDGNALAIAVVNYGTNSGSTLADAHASHAGRLIEAGSEGEAQGSVAALQTDTASGQ